MSEPHTGEIARRGMASNSVRARRLGLDTQYEAVVVMHKDCSVCRSEGFSAHARVLLCNGERHVIATLYQATGDLVAHNEAALSESAWRRLGLNNGGSITVTHPAPLDSLSHVRSRIYGHDLGEPSFNAIIRDVVDGKYSDIDLSSFLTACAARAARPQGNTRADPRDGGGRGAAAMAGRHRRRQALCRRPAGKPHDSHHRGDRRCARLDDAEDVVARDHVAGRNRRHDGDDGAGRSRYRRHPTVVEREGGCIVWGGAVKLSPADDILIRIERALDLDTEGQLIASVLSKKIAAGSTHLVIDVPVGPTAKVRSAETGRDLLSRGLIGCRRDAFGLQAKIVTIGRGRQPVGRGIGPALEARDVLAVLRGEPDAPQDLTARALALAGALLELAGAAPAGQGEAWRPRRSTTAAPGPNSSASARRRAECACRRPRATAAAAGGAAGPRADIDNRKLARLAKLAGAPDDKAAGVDLHVRSATSVTARPALVHRPCGIAWGTRLCASLCRGQPRHHRGPRTMTAPLLIAMPGNEAMAAALARSTRLATLGHLGTRTRFPTARPICDSSPTSRGAHRRHRLHA